MTRIRLYQLSAAALTAGDYATLALCDLAAVGHPGALDKIEAGLVDTMAQRDADELWAVYVGPDNPRDYSPDDIAEYVKRAPTCTDLTDGERALLTTTLTDYASR